MGACGTKAERATAASGTRVLDLEEHLATPPKRAALRQLKRGRRCDSVDCMVDGGLDSADDEVPEVPWENEAGNQVTSEEPLTKRPHASGVRRAELFDSSPALDDCANLDIVKDEITERTCSTCSIEDTEQDADGEGHREDSEPEEESEPQDPIEQHADIDLRPDFSGSWLCTRVEGDWDAYLKETGVSWGARVAVASMGFGVNKQIQHIEQTADSIHIVNLVKCCPPREAACRYRTDGLQEDLVDLEGKRTKSTTRWEGPVLVTKQRLANTPEVLPTAWRFMQGQEMCTERMTPTGLVVRRFYTRQR